MKFDFYTDVWYNKSGVRNDAPIGLIAVSEGSSYPFFPEKLLPICNHPMITKNGNELKEFLLTQLCYKYLQEICITETDVVNPTALNIAYGSVPVYLPEELQTHAFTIIIDEAFHSYVAKNFLNQVYKHTGFAPLTIPRKNELTKAIEKILPQVPTDMLKDIKLIATCISENIFTDEIINISRFTEVNEGFHQLMVQHARDEGRHAGYFVEIMKAYWKQSSIQQKNLFVEILPKFIEYCLDGIHDRDFLKELLKNCGLDNNQVEELVAENESESAAAGQLARLNNIIRCLKRSDFLEYAPLFDAVQSIKTRMGINKIAEII